jgi:mono/diheme cytochrome c family protein
VKSGEALVIARSKGLGRHFLVALGLLGVASACASPANDDAAAADAEHVAHLLGYLDADYARFGASEQAEHLALAAQAARLARRLRGAPELPEKIREVSALIEHVAPATDVHQHLVTLRNRLFALGRIERVPGAAPSLARGRVLFERNCATCHGMTGHADTALAATLRPHPANFSEPAFGATISPYDVTTAVRFGIDGTPMLPLPSLTETDRWNVAFYVVGLRHPGPQADDCPSFTPNELAVVNDNELGEQLFAAGISGASLPPALNALRRRAPFEAQMRSPIAAARRELDTARVATVRGDRKAARDAVLAAEEDGEMWVRSTSSSEGPELAAKLRATFSSLLGLARAGAPTDDVTEVIGATLGLLTYAERVTAVHRVHSSSVVPVVSMAREWPNETEVGAPASTTGISETSLKGACSDPGFGPGPDLHPTDGGVPFEVAHNCMFPGNDRLEVVVHVPADAPPKRAQIDGLLRNLLDQVRNATGERMPELTHINAFSADGKSHYGRLELDGDEGPRGELEIFLNVPFDAAEWSTTFAASHSTGFLGPTKPEVGVDLVKPEITVKYPFMDAGTDHWSERVTATRAYIEAFPWLFDFYPPRTEVQAVTFIGMRKGTPVFTVHVADLRTFLSMNPWPIRERMAAAGIPLEPIATRTPAQDAVLGQEYALALAKLPKGSLVVDRSLGRAEPPPPSIEQADGPRRR